MGRDVCHQNDDFGSIPGANMVEGKIQFPQIVPRSLLYMCYDRNVDVHVCSKRKSVPPPG